VLDLLYRHQSCKIRSVVKNKNGINKCERSALEIVLAILHFPIGITWEWELAQCTLATGMGMKEWE